MKRFLSYAAVAALLSLFACVGAMEEPPAGDTAGDLANALRCGKGKTFFNGACRASCASSADCRRSEECLVVAQGKSLCMGYASCAWKGSDTGCYAANGAYASPYDDDVAPYEFAPVSYGGGTGPSGSPQAFHCVGNGAWVKAPPTSDPGCGQTHAVMRCERVNAGECAPVPATTIDVAEP